MKFNTRFITTVLLVVSILTVFTDAGGKGLKKFFKKGGILMFGHRMLPMPMPFPIPIPTIHDSHHHLPCPKGPEPIVTFSHSVAGKENEWRR